MSRPGNYMKALKKAQTQVSVSDSTSSVSDSTSSVPTPPIVKVDPFLENLKKTNPEAYSTQSPFNPNDTLYYIQQDGNWVQTW